MTQQGKGKKVGLFVGIGCLALSGLCCVGMAIAVYVPKRASDSTAKEKAEAFLGHLQRRDYAAAFAESEYAGSSSNLYSPQQFQTCYEATPLADLTAFECDGVESAPFSNEGDVTCEVTSASHGTSEITVHVNSTASMPYLGFVWFSPGATMGEAWRGEGCTRWSGRQYFDDPPEGRVRP